MKSIFPHLLVGLSLAFLSFSTSTYETVAAQPNVILCMTDDQGWGDTGYNGHPYLKTPHLDQMSKEGVTLAPMQLILFGGPGPGGKAMASAPTLGLDAFYQKLLVWQDASGTVHVTWNDLLALAERQQVSGGLALKVINHRLQKTFSTALEQ